MRVRALHAASLLNPTQSSLGSQLRSSDRHARTAGLGCMFRTCAPLPLCGRARKVLDAQRTFSEALKESPVGCRVPRRRRPAAGVILRGEVQLNHSARDSGPAGLLHHWFDSINVRKCVLHSSATVCEL